MKHSHSLTDEQRLSFYQGLYQEEALTLFGAHMCPEEIESQEAFHEVFHRHPDWDEAAKFHDKRFIPCIWKREKQRTTLDAKVASHEYSNRTILQQSGTNWLNSDMECLGKQVGRLREKALCTLLLKEGKRIFATDGPDEKPSRSSVSHSISENLIRLAVRELYEQRPYCFKRIPDVGPDFKTKDVNISDHFVLVSHPALRGDLGEIMEKQKVSANTASICPRARGRIDDVLILFADETVFPIYYGAGEKTARTNSVLESSKGSRIDVYPVIITAVDAWASLPFRKIKDRYEPTFTHYWEGENGTITVNYAEAFAIQNPCWYRILEVGVKQKSK